jgi:hypothetical protein
MAEIEGGTLYEMNQSLMANEKKLSGFDIIGKKKSLQAYFNNSMSKYFMMLCRERSDYTLFKLGNHTTSAMKAADEVILCMKNRGDILAIDRTPSNNSYEIWIRDEDGVNSCYYLFEYDEGVIEC